MYYKHIEIMVLLYTYMNVYNSTTRKEDRTIRNFYITYPKVLPIEAKNGFQLDISNVPDVSKIQIQSLGIRQKA